MQYSMQCRGIVGYSVQDGGTQPYNTALRGMVLHAHYGMGTPAVAAQRSLTRLCVHRGDMAIHTVAASTTEGEWGPWPCTIG